MNAYVSLASAEKSVEAWLLGARASEAVPGTGPSLQGSRVDSCSSCATHSNGEGGELGVRAWASGSSCREPAAWP